MVVCRYFLQGRCAFGDRCKNEHVYDYTYDNDRQSYNNHRTYASDYNDYGNYNYNNDYQRNNNYSNIIAVKAAPVSRPVAPAKDENQERAKKLFDDVIQEIVAAERGGQWPLSSFTPVRERSSLPGLEDISPEELRSVYYDLKASNRPIDVYVELTKRLIKNGNDAKQILKDPSQGRKILEDLLSGKDLTTSSAKSSFRFDSATTSQTNIFGQTVNNVPSQQSGQSIFSQPSAMTNANSQSAGGNIFSSGFETQPSQTTGSIFGSSATSLASPSTGSIFGASATSQPSQSTGGSIFGSPVVSQPSQSTSSIFGSSVVSQPSQSTTSIFGSSVVSQPSQSTGSIFGSSASSQSSPVQSNIFGPAATFQTTQPGNSIFGQTPQPSVSVFSGSQNVSTNMFGQATSSGISSTNVFSAPVSSVSGTNVSLKAEDGHYSIIENLSDDEIAAFQSKKFSEGKIPLHPPVQSMCL